MIVLKNLPENQKYEVEVSAWLKDRAEKTVFQKQEIELNNTLEEAFDICLSDEKVENLNEGTTVGTFTVNEMAPEGNYVFSLCTGEGDTHNPYFAIENGVLKTAKNLEEGKTYTIRLKAKNAAPGPLLGAAARGCRCSIFFSLPPGAGGFTGTGGKLWSGPAHGWRCRPSSRRSARCSRRCSPQ